MQREQSFSAQNPFWDFSLGIYAAPGVGEVCIALQDTFDADVNVLLFLLWLAGEGRAVRAEEIDAHAAEWREGVVRPLRNVRRLLKEPAAASAEIRELRSRIKKAELDAEHLLQDKLYEYYQSLGGNPEKPSRALAEQNLRGYETFLGAKFPDSATGTLLDAWEASLR